MDEKAVCCLALEQVSFMGSHDRTEVKGPQGQAHEKALKGRYGKWRAQVVGNPVLQQQLTQYGGEGLRIFEYESASSSPEISVNTEEMAISKSGFHCSVSSVTCSPLFPVLKRENILPEVIVVQGDERHQSGQCLTHKGLDYRAGGVDITTLQSDSIHACCGYCLNNRECKYFTFSKTATMCYLKSGKGLEVVDGSTVELVSGDRNVQ